MTERKKTDPNRVNVAVLLEKGVIVGVEQGVVYRESLSFMMYKMNSKVKNNKPAFCE